MSKPTPFKLLAAALALLASLAFAPTALAQTCAVPAPDDAVANYAIVSVKLSSCLGQPERDPDSLTKSFVESLEKPVAANYTQGVEAALDQLLAEAGERSRQGFDTALWKAMVNELTLMRGQAAKLSNVSDASEWRKASIALVPSKWKGAADGLDLDGQEYDVVKPPAQCQNGQACPAFASRVAALRVINLVKRLDVHMESDFILQHFAEGRIRLQRWEAYRDKAHALYWWEVFANGALMDSPLLGSDGKAPCEKDANGTSIGFCNVPTRQLVFLHPEAAVRFSRTAEKSSDLKAALTVELLGWYWWDWASPTSAEMRGRRGFSLAASYTSTHQEAKLGYGPMFHWNDFSLAVTKANRGEWSLVLNVPLGDKLYGRKQQIVDELSKAKKSSFADLLMK